MPTVREGPQLGSVAGADVATIPTVDHEAMPSSPKDCPVCKGTPSVIVAIAHPALRRLILDLLDRDRTRWNLHTVTVRRDLPAAVATANPDLVVLDDGDIGWCLALGPVLAPQYVIVIGPEPDPAYERAARRAGAGAWVSRDRVGEDLIPCMRSVLGCNQSQRPPLEHDRRTCVLRPWGDRADRRIIGVGGSAAAPHDPRGDHR